MLIVRKSRHSDISHTREINVTQEQINKWMDGTLIQEAMPDVSKEDREFILSGITPEEWLEVFVPGQGEEP